MNHIRRRAKIHSSNTIASSTPLLPQQSTVIPAVGILDLERITTASTGKAVEILNWLQSSWVMLKMLMSFIVKNLSPDLRSKLMSSARTSPTPFLPILALLMLSYVTVEQNSSVSSASLTRSYRLVRLAVVVVVVVLLQTEK